MSTCVTFRSGATASVEEFRSERLRERYFRVRHPSGLWIYLFPKASTTTSALYATRFGGADRVFRRLGDAEDTVLPEGCAHFLEHKMFDAEDGTDAFERFSELGADANAYTSWDKTAYLFHATEEVPACLETLLGFVSSPHFTDETVEKEQGIIAEEIRMNDDNPAERCFTNLLRAMYRENAIRNEICGSEASIARITPAILYDCCDAFYRPSNMALVVAGSVPLSEVLRAVDAVLPQEAPREEIPVVRRDENAGETAAVRIPRIEEKMQVGKPMFVIGIKDHAAMRLSAEARMRRDVLMTVLKEIYFSSSGELYNEMLDDELISPGFSAAYGATPLYAFFEIAGESDDPDAVLCRVKDALRNAAREGIDAESFERARRVMYAKAVKSFDSTRTVSEMLLDYVFSGYELFRYISLFEEITREEAEALLREAFSDEAFALSVVSPDTDATRNSQR